MAGDSSRAEDSHSKVGHERSIQPKLDLDFTRLICMIALWVCLLAAQIQSSTPTKQNISIPGFKSVDDPYTMQDKESPGYMVSSINGNLRVETRKDWEERQMAEYAATHKGKPKYVVNLGDSSLNWYAGDGVKVHDGWLDYADVGEFGGGIVWVARDQSKYRVISRDNTRFLASTSKGLFAVQSLEHGLFWFSRMVKLEPSLTGWKVGFVSDLHEVLTAITVDGDHLLFASQNFVSTLEANGSQRELYRFPAQVSPQSIAIVNREIWVGTGSHLLRLVFKDGEYRGDWLERS